MTSLNNQHFQTAERLVYLHLRNGILGGELAGGTRINPGTVAAELGVSRMPVREALRQLELEGLVTIPPNRRAVVTQLTAAEVEELFEIRAVLEALAVRYAVPHLDDESIEELELLNQHLDKARKNPKEWVRRHAEFHSFIVRQSGRQQLETMIERIQSAVQPYLLMYNSLYLSIEMPGYEHHNLIAVLRTRNADAAEAYMRDHIRSASRGLIDFLENRECADGPERRQRSAVGGAASGKASD